MVLLAVAFGLVTYTTVRQQQAAEALAAKPRPPATDLLAAVKAARPKVALWIGDSFTAGTGAISPQQSEACLTSIKLGYVCALDAQGGTGFIADGNLNSKTFSPLGKRLAATAKEYPAPALIVIDAGRNDWWAPTGQFESASKEYFDRLEKAYPATRVAIVAPYVLGAEPTKYAEMRAWLKAQASDRDWVYVDPIARGWTSDLAGMTIDDGVHPNPAGHEAIAVKLARDLSKLAADKS